MGRGQTLKEWPRDYRPSGNSYLAAWFDGKPEVIRVLNEVRCDHVSSACTACVYQWEWDYEVLYDRTAAGRRLKALRSS
jgi:hypothetical protein